LLRRIRLRPKAGFGGHKSAPRNDELRGHGPKPDHWMDLIADHISHRFGALEVLD
jgi:hypothetical protein